MKQIKDFLLLPVWKFVIWYERKFRLSAERGTAFLVMGFARNGTSLISSLMQTCGVYMGEENELRGPGSLNPRGFFEHNEFFKVCRSYIEEAGFVDDMMAYGGYRARGGIYMKFRRVFTRRALARVLWRISKGVDRWGLKCLPVYFYFVRQYLPRYRIIGVYRDPFSSVYSLTRAWPAGRYTFEQGLLFWTRSNKDLLYHILTSDSILIRFEDLFDVSKRDKILERLVSFIGTGDPKMLAKLIDPTLNRSSKQAEQLRRFYTLSEETKEVLRALDNVKNSYE